MVTNEALWPALETAYQDEFGPVDPELHRVAREVWPRAEHLAVQLLHDRDAGYGLLKRAVAAVSALPPDRRLQIRDPAAYLFQTYKRLVLAELKTLNSHRAHELQIAALLRGATEDVERIDRDILIQELVHRMDAWTCEVFKSLVLGYTFEEIGRVMGSNPHVIRNRFRLSLRRLAAIVGAPEGTQPSRLSRSGRAVSRCLKRLRMMRIRLLNPSTRVAGDDSGNS